MSGARTTMDIRKKLQRCVKDLTKHREVKEKCDLLEKNIEKENMRLARLQRKLKYKIDMFQEERKDCEAIFGKTFLDYERKCRLEKIFSGENSVLYYMDYYIDLCGRMDVLGDEAKKLELFFYNNVLLAIEDKLNMLEWETEQVEKSASEEFERRYRIKEKTGRLFKYENVQPGAIRIELENPESLQRQLQQVKSRCTKTEHRIKQWEEADACIRGIREEWTNRNKALKQGSYGRYKWLYEKLSVIPWHDYALRAEEDLEEYKERFLSLESEFRKLRRQYEEQGEVWREEE